MVSLMLLSLWGCACKIASFPRGLSHFEIKMCHLLQLCIARFAIVVMHSTKLITARCCPIHISLPFSNVNLAVTTDTHVSLHLPILMNDQSVRLTTELLSFRLLHCHLYRPAAMLLIRGPVSRLPLMSPLLTCSWCFESCVAPRKK